NGRITTLTTKNGLPCDAVHWSLEDDVRSIWLKTDCGLVRIALSDLDAWVTDPHHAIQTTVFDSFDGARSFGTAGTSSRVAKSGDGNLWFVAVNGVSVIDPHHLPINKLPPPVHIETITADRRPYDVTAGLRLPPLVRDLQIKYTALSLVV